MPVKRLDMAAKDRGKRPMKNPTKPMNCKENVKAKSDKKPFIYAENAIVRRNITKLSILRKCSFKPLSQGDLCDISDNAGRFRTGQDREKYKDLRTGGVAA